MAVQIPPAPPTPDSDTDIEAGVIEDARARQRKQKRAGGLLAAALLAGIAALAIGSGGGGGHPGTGQHSDGLTPAPGASHGYSDATPVVSAAPGYEDEMGLLAPGVGWVANYTGLYLTRDSGRRWHALRTHALPGNATADVTASTPSSPALMLSAINRGSVYARCATPDASTSTSAALPLGSTLLSSDSGLRWRTSSLPKCLTPTSLSFVNARDGFLFGHYNHYGFPAPALYMTTSAGRKWKRVGRPPFEGTVSFANARDGLGGGVTMGAGPVDSADIDRTSDGGRSWTRTSLCRPATVFDCEAPSLFRSGRGVVLVTKFAGQPGRSVVEVYTTRNFGVSWSAHVLPGTPPLVDSGTWVPFSAPNQNDLFAWISPYLYRSTDGGLTWSRAAEPMLAPTGAQQNLSNMDFASSEYGWYDNAGILDYTTDGGRHWTPVGHVQ